MRHIVCDISHPAHVHFFRNPILIWRDLGHRVDIVSRDKDITLELLSAYGLESTCLSRVRSGLIGLGMELIEHQSRLVRRFWTDRPDIFVQIGGALIVHAAALMRRPSVVFYDTEFARLSNAITYPFASVVCTPACYDRPVRARHVRYPGYHELAYLHPKRFAPDASVVCAAGLRPGEAFTIVRFVRWDSNHDTGLSGLGLEGKRALIEQLRQHGKVLISSETPLPEDLAEYRLTLAPHLIHHLLAYADLYVGESATMASESAILGVPAIFVSDVGRGYTDEQERVYGLCRRLPPSETAGLLQLAASILATPNRRAHFAEARARLLDDTIDITDWIVEFVEQFR